MRSLAVIDAIETMDQIDRVRNRPTQTVCESSGIEDNECDRADSDHKKSIHESAGIKSADCEFKNGSIDGRRKWVIPRSTRR